VVAIDELVTEAEVEADAEDEEERLFFREPPPTGTFLREPPSVQ
jgi:hypothetical protein